MSTKPKSLSPIERLKSLFGLAGNQYDKVLRLTFRHKGDVIDSVRQGHSDQGWNFKNKLVIGSGPFVRWRVVDREYAPHHKLIFTKNGKLYLALPQRKFVTLSDEQGSVPLTRLKPPGKFPANVLKLNESIRGTIQLNNDWNIDLDFITPPQVVVTPDQKMFLASVSVKKWWEPYDFRQYTGIMAVFGMLFIMSFFYFTRMKDKIIIVEPYNPPEGVWDGGPEKVIPVPEQQSGQPAQQTDAGTTHQRASNRTIGATGRNGGAGTGTGSGSGRGSGSGAGGLQRPGTGVYTGVVATLAGRTGTGSGLIGGGGGYSSSSGGGGYALVGQTYKPFDPNEVVDYGSSSSTGISGDGDGYGGGLRPGEIGQGSTSGPVNVVIKQPKSIDQSLSRPTTAGPGDTQITSTVSKPTVDKPTIPDSVKITGLSSASDKDNIASQIRRRQALFDKLFQDYTARVKRVRGEVSVSMKIDANGRATAVVRSSSAGIPRDFTDRIKQLVEGWTFNVTAEQTYGFKLQFS